MTSPINSSTSTNPWQYPDPTTQSTSSASSSGTQRAGGHHHHHHSGSVSVSSSSDATSGTASTDPTQDPFLEALDSESSDPTATTAAATQSGQTLDTFL